jgi:outer membrane protein TolC
MIPAALLIAAWMAHAYHAVAAEGPQPEPLSLPQAVELAREHSPIVMESRANSESAWQASKEASLSRLPALDLRETGVRTDSPADVFGMQLMQERFSFPAFVASDPNQPSPLDNFTSQVEATMPLFTGGRLSGGIRQAGHMAEAAQAMQEHTAAAVDLGVADAYLSALLADRFVELAERARDTTRRHVEKAQDFYNAGMIVESDLLQAQVQLSKMDENLIRARNGANLARAGLNRAMGIEQDRSFLLADPPLPSDSLLGSYDASVEQAMRSRKDILAVERKVAAAQAGIGRARGEYWPQIGVSARYSWNDDRLFGSHGESYMLTAMAQWQVWNWGQTRARVSRSRSDYQAAMESQRSYREEVEFEIRQAAQGLEEARASHEVSQGAVRAAEKALTILEDRFNQGLTKMTDLLDAETMAHEARVQETQTRYDLQKAIRTLRFSIGLPPIPEVSQ